MTPLSTGAGGQGGGNGPSLRQRLRYRFDNSLTHGPIALIGWLGVVVAVAVVVSATVAYFLLGSAPGDNLLDELWNNAIRLVSVSENASPWPTRLFLVVAGLMGVFIGGSLIGLIATVLDQRVQKLSAGRSAVLETGHTLILGWSARLPVIVQELVVANQNRARPAIVILAARPVADMEAALRELGDPGNTRLVCRSGNPTKGADLVLVNITTARSVIVLTDEGGDAAAVKAILAIKILDPDFSRTRVVAEFADPGNAETIRSLTDGRVATVNSDEVIAQVTAQACHQAGLSVVLRDLLNFGDNECYFLEVPQLAGHTYAEALLGFEGSSVVGRHTVQGEVQLNPPPGTVFGAGDRVIAVAQDDDSATFAGFREVEQPTPAAPGGGGLAPMQILIVGWSTFGPQVIDQLEAILPSGSQIEVCVDPSLATSLVTSLEIEQERPGLRVSLSRGGPERLRAVAESVPIDQVIVLGYRSGLTTSEADARTLLTLLTLRRIWPATQVPRVRIIAQLLDQSNVELATITGVDDFIVSDALASLMLAQLSERTELQAVFDDMFDPREATLQLWPAHQLVPDAPVAYAQIVAAGAAQQVSVIGWRVNSTGDVVVNPARDRQVHLAGDDQVLLVGGIRRS